jgi:hypothetical protein
VLDVIIASGITVAAAGLFGLIRPLLRSVLYKRVGKSKDIKITVQSEDGTARDLKLQSTDLKQLNEDQLKQILKLLSEADSDRSETDNSKT